MFVVVDIVVNIESFSNITHNKSQRKSDEQCVVDVLLVLWHSVCKDVTTRKNAKNMWTI